MVIIRPKFKYRITVWTEMSSSERDVPTLLIAIDFLRTNIRYFTVIGSRIEKIPHE